MADKYGFKKCCYYCLNRKDGICKINNNSRYINDDCPDFKYTDYAKGVRFSLINKKNKTYTKEKAIEDVERLNMQMASLNDEFSSQTVASKNDDDVVIKVEKLKKEFVDDISVALTELSSVSSLMKTYLPSDNPYSKDVKNIRSRLYALIYKEAVLYEENKLYEDAVVLYSFIRIYKDSFGRISHLQSKLKKEKSANQTIVINEESKIEMQTEKPSNNYKKAMHFSTFFLVLFILSAVIFLYVDSKLGMSLGLVNGLFSLILFIFAKTKFKNE